MPVVFFQSRRLVLSLVLAGALTLANVGQALETVDFRVAGQNTDVEEALRGASLLLALESREADDVFAAARGEYGRLVGALYAQGHYSPVVSVRIDGREASAIAPLDAPERIGQVTVSVDPGPQFTFAVAQVAPMAPGSESPADFRPGAPARSGVVKEAVAVAIDGWRDIGHAKAVVAGQKLLADHRANRLDVDVRLNPGPRLRFGPVAIEGNERTRTNRVRRIAGLPEGEVFDPAEVERAASRLRRTGAFRSVTITEDKTVTAPDLLGMTIAVVPEKPRRLSFGAEISSLDGLDLSASWMHRNLFGGAEKLVVEGEVSQIGAQDNGTDYRLSLAIDRPATLTPDTTARIRAEVEHVDEGYLVADGFEAGLGFTHVFSDTLTGRIDLTYDFIDGTLFADNGANLGDFRYRALTLPIGLTWDRRDNKTDAKSGYYLDAELKPFYGFGTTGSGMRAFGDLRGYYGFGAEKRFVLAGRVQAGGVFGAALADTPHDDRFLSGGGGTVRGQPFQSLGLQFGSGASSFEVGGNRFLAASVEARVKVSEKIGVVGFVDAGRVGLDSFFGSNGDWHAGAGLGLRYDTGIGPIRLDIAAPVRGRTGKGVQIYVGLGQAF